MKNKFFLYVIVTIILQRLLVIFLQLKNHTYGVYEGFSINSNSLSYNMYEMLNWLFPIIFFIYFLSDFIYGYIHSYGVLLLTRGCSKRKFLLKNYLTIANYTLIFSLIEGIVSMIMNPLRCQIDMYLYFKSFFMYFLSLFIISIFVLFLNLYFKPEITSLLAQIFVVCSSLIITIFPYKIVCYATIINYGMSLRTGIVYKKDELVILNASYSVVILVILFLIMFVISLRRIDKMDII